MVFLIHFFAVTIQGRHYEALFKPNLIMPFNINFINSKIKIITANIYKIDKNKNAEHIDKFFGSLSENKCD